ncbi:DUF3192 domain-containing protein [Lacimicrobium alkaliphilum]|uniref:DUF3192 domain-containing protein n=1 Tax=Lacimicrobium alkaliphilum TaxID=1526571 RepID=A0ABQ1RHR1_9ALTE|nr:DUF3192 domain-containing protein [Lacimicrobium alkaliphilum]GGD66932.1 hypothetical protein GCM10011357_22670 [Lacimicrobium alkaliphilum]
MKKTIAALSVLTVFTLSGCVISVGGDDHHDGNWQKKEAKNRRMVAQLKPGLGFDHVSSQFGSPDFSEFHQNDAGSYQVLFYRTHRNEGDGVTTMDECTPLVFKDAELIGWGQSAYAAIK